MKFFQRYTSIFGGLFADKSLTRKAYLNALSSAIAYVSQLVVALLITPLMVSGLGDYFYGTWQVLNRIVGYLSPVSGRSTVAIKWTLANQQADKDFDLKRRSVGSSVAVWLIFLPLLGISGAILAWFVPLWLKSPVVFIWQIRLTTFLLVLNLIMTNIVLLPQSVLQGENLGYKRIGLTPLLTILGGVLTWVVLFFNMGIAELAIVALCITFLSGLLYLNVVRKNVVWFGISRPKLREVRSFFHLSVWFLAWDIVFNLMIASDVVVLGILQSVVSVTSYTLTKYVPETIISFIAIIIFGIAPGLGGIIGSGEVKKAVQIRGEIISITWLVTTILGATIIIWNRLFLSLWVGEQQYAGPLPNLLIVFVVAQFVFIRVDANVIDLTLNIKTKVWLGALSVGLSLIISIFLVGFLHLGITGVLVGTIIGRLLLSMGYPMIVGRYLGVSFHAQVRNIGRPMLISAALFYLSYIIDSTNLIHLPPGLTGWLLLSIFAGISSLTYLLISFLLGLSKFQRAQLLKRFRLLFPQFSG